MAEASRLLLLGCGAKKRAAPADSRVPGHLLARDLYVGSLFRSRMAYADASQHEVWIVSARLGLVDPDEWVMPYEADLRTFSALDRAGWALGTVQELVDLLPDARRPQDVHLELHMGEAYASILRDVLRAVGFAVSWPVQGMGVHAVRSWYSRQTRALLGGTA